MEDEIDDTDFLPELAGLVNEPKGEYGKRKSNAEFARAFRARLKAAAIKVVNFMHQQPSGAAMNVIRHQLLKSATSAAANYRAARRARSGREFFAKMSIVVEETDETLFWLEILRDSVLAVDDDAITTLGKEWQEILMVVARARSNIKQ